MAELAREETAENDFESAVRDRITAYRAAAQELQKERRSLAFRVRCELGKAGTGAAVSLLGTTAVSSVLSQMQTAMGAATVLLAGCLWSIDKVKDLKPMSDQLRAAEAEFRDNACFGLHNFYRNIGRTVGSDVLP